jgi:ketosteroid isomerase-like protein
VTEQQRRELALGYLRALDRGEPVLGMLAKDAEITFPKWGTARGHEQIAGLYGDLGRRFRRFSHNTAGATVVQQGATVVVAGRSSGILRDGGAWEEHSPGSPWCAVIEERGGLIARVAVYLDPDFDQSDRARYPWPPHTT